MLQAKIINTCINNVCYKQERRLTERSAMLQARVSTDRSTMLQSRVSSDRSTMLQARASTDIEVCHATSKSVD